MAKRKSKGNGQPAQQVDDYRYRQAKRKNIPPEKIAAEGTVPAVPKARYEYNAHLPPVLRFDPTGSPDKLPPLLAKAAREKLSADEVQLLAEALRTHEPWLEWSGKREAKDFEVDPVALHIHERISAQAILKVAARQDIEKTLFGGGTEQAYQEAVQFYRHDIDWTNRLILGDSLAVMSSLAKREDLAGKVQMIYIDPPYGIKFASNFQPEIGRRDVKEKEQDLTREPEMVKAYRDTWNLGIHSYLSYLRDRLVAARELLADTGSIFVQIGDENLHVVRDVLDEVFGRINTCALITIKKTGGLGSDLLKGVADHILWYARDRDRVRYRQLHLVKQAGEGDSTGARYDQIEDVQNGQRRALTEEERENIDVLPTGLRFYQSDNLVSSGFTPSCTFPFEHDGQTYSGGGQRSTKKNKTGMKRMQLSNRLIGTGVSLRFARFLDDYPAYEISNLWDDVATGTEKVYVVQTGTKIVERCLLMTTDPGDLVLDPTCGSATTAYVAEQWGRRWITIDTSRVALSIARQRLLTAKFDYYKTNPTPGASGKDPNGNPSNGFMYKTVPHITLKSIAQNVPLDPIFAKHEPILEEKLKPANAALANVSTELRHKLEAKLLAKQRNEGKKAITDADRRRWLLPPENRDRSAEVKKGATVDLESKQWYAWEVPYDTDLDWPKALQDAVKDYRTAWRTKMDEVNACIAAAAEPEELVDQPEIVRGVTRVSGPFTVEAVQPPEMSLGDVMEPQNGSESAVQGSAEEGKFAGEPNTLDTFNLVRPVVAGISESSQNLTAYLDKMIRLLRLDGVRFPNNKQMAFTRLEAIYENRSSQGFHAEGRWAPKGESDPDPQGGAAVGVVIGPQYGPVTAKMVENLIRPASRRYEDLVVAGFSFTGEAQSIISESPHPKLRIHVANIRPDVNPAMEGLLKEQPGAQLFTVFGQPRIAVQGPDKEGQYVVEMEGVDIYNPVDNSIAATGADKVAAWFLDGDYDGRTFCITQAFFPDKSAWEKLSRALNGKDGLIDAERFEALSGTVSLPFPAGKHKTVAVKVIDPRGNEVMSVQPL